MTRRKRTPPPDSPRKRGAFEIPNSLAQLSALSRSLAQRTDNIHGVDKETENSGIVARAQALSNSPPLTASSVQPPKPIRWKHDQKDFPSAQQWIQPNPSSGSKAHAKAIEHQRKEAQALEMSRLADTLSLGRQSFPPSSMPSQDYTAGPGSRMRRQSENAGNSESDQSPTPESSSAAGKKRKRVDFVNRHQREFSDSQPWSESTARGVPKSFDQDTEQRRQAIIAQLMQTGPVSVSSAGTNIQVPTNPRATPSSSSPVAHQTGPPDQEALDMTKDSGQIAALIAKKRAENATTGQLNRLQYLQAQHRQQHGARHSWPGSGHCMPQVSSQQPASNLPPWSISPSQAPVRASVETAQNPNQTGYAEASTASAGGGEENAELDLRSLFSSPGPSPHPGDRSGEDETDRALRNAINNVNNAAAVLNRPPSGSVPAPSQPNAQGAASPSDQLLSNLAHVSSDALAQLNTESTTSRRPQVPTMRPPPPFPANRLPQLAARKLYKPPIQTPQAQAKVVSTLTPQQQELMLIQRQAEQSQMETKTKELRRFAEERAKRVQEENQRRHEQNQQQDAGQQDQGQWIPQPSMAANSTADSAHWKLQQQSIWGNVGMAGYSPGYTQNMPVGVVSATGTRPELQRPMSAGYGGYANSTAPTAARFRNASQMGFEVPKR